MELNTYTLIIPDKADPERDMVADYWIRYGGQVERLGRFWEPPEYLKKTDVRVYGNEVFCLILAQKLNLALVSPPDDLILKLSPKWLGRDIATCELSSIDNLPYPIFIKPLAPKQFEAKVYTDLASIKNMTNGLPIETKTITSSIVSFTAEARTFVLNNKVLDCEFYEGTGNTDEVIDFVNDLCKDTVLPRTCVIDVGFIANSGYAFIEANSTWGAGLNGCRPQKVIPAIFQASHRAY